LKEFFPVDFFYKVTANMTSCYETEEDGEEDEEKLEKPSKSEDKTLTMLEALSTCINWRQILTLLEEVRQHVYVALQHPELYADKVKDAGPSIKDADSSMKDVAQYAACNTTNTFSDDDLLLGSKPHNRPLFVTGYIREQKVKRILVDGGSAVNIIPKSTMHDLGITTDDLSKSRMVIQGFSLESQRAIGTIRLELTLADLSTSSIFHVIDSKTSYKLLLGRPWLHEHGIVALTLRQCLKYYRGGERKINGDVKPFTKAESHFADSKFFEEDFTPKEMMISTISFTGKQDPKVVKDTSVAIGHNAAKSQQPYRKDDEQVEKIQSIKQDGKQVVTSAHSAAPVLRYVPKSRRKEGESPFTRVTRGNTEDKAIRKANEVSMIALKGNATVPAPKAGQSKVSRPPLAGFVVSSSGSDNLPNAGTEEGFDKNAYKLMEKAGYDFQNLPTLGKVVEAKPHGLNETQRKIQE